MSSVIAEAPMPTDSPPCIQLAWQQHEKPLRRFLVGRTGRLDLAEDILQEVFLKALRQRAQFCRLANPRAWLFRVARTTLIDHWRRERPGETPGEQLAAMVEEERDPVELLDVCLLRNLARLSPQDRAIIETCDLHGKTVREYAASQAIGLAAAKSRLLRARLRLRHLLQTHCEIHFDDVGRVCCHTPPTN
jgi:RNA polymerase sigma-70 factor, ECF subfamily